MQSQLTPKQQRFLDYLQREIAKTGLCPSLRQAAADLREAWCKIGCTPDFPGPNPDATPWITPEYLAFYKKVKMALDPNHIMHRGMSPIVEY